MAIDIQSFNQILGSMVRKIIAETPVSDVNPGSIFLSLLEACASNDFENNVAILNILELLSIDAIRNSDLDNKAADFGLTRFAAIAATGSVSILNTTITKQSTSLYSIKPAPISGQTVLFVNNTTNWTPTGSIYIGRGTNSFEGPIPYTSISVFSTYSQVNLGSALQNNHLSSDIVINAQGQPDRLIPAGTVVKIPANNQNPEIDYSTLRDAVLPAGETEVDNVLVLANIPGSQGNALINTINTFNSVPFTGAGITNTSSFTTGSDIETDTELRNRIKSYAASLARGTVPAILNAVIGLSDPDENKRVASASLAQPVSVGQPSILYVDDGTGFQPSYAGQAIDVLLANANGTEEFLQLSNYPLPRPQVVNTDLGPFTFLNNMFLRVAVDGQEDDVVFSTSDFLNISNATVNELINAINAKATLFVARLTNDSANILIYPINPNAETIQVVPLRSTDNSELYANTLLNFPTQVFSYISLYQNSTLLKQEVKVATVETVPFASWSLLAPGDLILSVDNTSTQDGAFTIADFIGASSFTTLALSDWVTAFNTKFAGITAVATPGQTMQISSNKNGNGASIAILGGSYQNRMFGANTLTSTGQASEFQINRQTGNIKILTPIVAGDTISAGVADAKGFVVSTATSNGIYNLDIDGVGRPAQMVICVDATKCNKIPVNIKVNQTLQFISESGSVMRILAPAVDVFNSVQPGHYIYIVPKSSSWVNSSNAGLFKVIRRGTHLSAGVDTYIEVLNIITFNQTVIVADIADVAAFDTDVYPQVWRNSYLLSPASASLTDVVNSLINNIQGVNASIFRSNSVKVTSTTENSGSIAIPVSVGNAASIFLATETVQLDNQPLIANKISQKDMFGFLKTQPIISGNSWLGRAMYPLATGALTANAGEDPPPYSGAYAETITANVLTSGNVDFSDEVLFTRGNNRELIRAIAAKPASTEIGTQEGLPRTIFNHIIGDEVALTKSLQFASDDNITYVMDEDATLKTINIKMARTGQVNSGSQSGSFTPTTTEFSANDVDNQSGIDFGTVNVWGTTLNGTNFADYAILMRARNWYATGGTTGSNGKLVIRSTEYGQNGNKMRFNIRYPTIGNQTNASVLVDTPSFNTLSYYFGSGSEVAIGMSPSTVVTITGPYPDASTNFPAGSSSSGNYYDFNFASGTWTGVLVNNVISFLSGCGLSSSYLGQFGIKAISGNIIRLFNPSASAGTPTITTPADVRVFPLVNTTIADIITSVNASNILVATPISATSATILVSTTEDQYSYSSNATALGYGHNPTSSSLRNYIGLYDGINFVKNFENANPNFVIKVPFTLTSSGVSSAIYALNTTTNEDATTGEYFKLVPTTVLNVQHHLTQKALSQLPIVSNIAISDAGKNVQVISQQLGSSGAIQVLGGHANLAQTFVVGESQVSADSSGSYLQCSISAFPNTYSVGDVVQVQNEIGVKRLSRLELNNRIDVISVSGGNAEYYWYFTNTGFVAATTITITDVSSSYNDYNGNPLAAGLIWRWTHSTSHSETLSAVNVGDIVSTFGVGSGWFQGNLAKSPGDGAVAGLPIIAVNDSSHYFDVVCPFGKAMSATAIGFSGVVFIFPSPIIKWNLCHSARIPTLSIARSSNVITVDTLTAHNLNTGDNVTIQDSAVVADGTYGPITTTSTNIFTFSNTGSNVTEPQTGASILRSTAIPTKYRLQKIGINNFTKISRTAGDSPRFADCGVAVDDYITISGTTFNNLNNGTFRVLAVDNDSVVFANPNTVEGLNTTIPFNNLSLGAVWTANSAVVSGPVGTFKQLSLGNWVKKQEDPDSTYLQVTAYNNGSFAAATQITLGNVYGGINGTSLGVAYDQTVGYDAGVYLQSGDDISFLEGDSVQETDTLYVQNIVDNGWFNINNAGSFPIITIGTEPSLYRPFVRVKNVLAVNEFVFPVNTGHDFYIVESNLNKFSSYRLITNSVINDSNSLNRYLYMLPDSKQYKFSQANSTAIVHTGKLGYDLNISTGTDGYLFYTGLLRRVQRTVDGFNPDPTTFPELRAVGSSIETLPPLINNVSIVITVTTNQGAVLQDIQDNIRSAVIDYVNSLGVGQNVVLAAIIAAVMGVKGVATVTFNSPAPSEAYISIASNEKAIITADNIGIA